MKGSIYMVFDYMDHDLTGLMEREGHRFTVPQVSQCRLQIMSIMHVWSTQALAQRQNHDTDTAHASVLRCCLHSALCGWQPCP